MQGFLIGVFIYSFILTIVLLYKDNSSYYDIETIDLIVSGPITWVLLLIFYIIRSILKLFSKKEKPKKPYKKKDSKLCTLQAAVIWDILYDNGLKLICDRSPYKLYPANDTIYMWIADVDPDMLDDYVNYKYDNTVLTKLGLTKEVR